MASISKVSFFNNIFRRRDKRRPNNRGLFSRLFFRILDKRIKTALYYRLNRHNLYTFPSRLGFLFIFLIFIMWLMGTNYQNNLILGLCYLLVSLFVVGILHTYGNMAGIDIKFLGAKSDFVGENIKFVLEIKSPHKMGSYNLAMRWQSSEIQYFNLSSNEPVQIELLAPTKERGELRPGRLLIESNFPLGLIRCWSWLKLDAKAIVYPRPLEVEIPKGGTHEGDDTFDKVSENGVDLYGLRAYRVGDSPKNVSWKNFARGGDLLSKEFSRANANDSWLDWNVFSHLSYEEKISALCFCVLHMEKVGRPYGVRIPGSEISPSAGEAHCINILTALALLDKS